MRPLLATGLLCALVACDALFGPGEGGEAVIVSSEEQPHLKLVRVADGQVVARLGPAPRGAHGFARSQDSAMLYYAGIETYPERRVLALELRSLGIAWQHLLTDLEQRSRVPNLELLSVHDIAPSPDGSRLLVAPGRKDGVFGVAVLDGATRDPIDFLAPLMVPREGMATIPPSTTFPSGALVTAGSRDQSLGPKNGWLFFLEGEPLTLRDSVQLTRDAGGRWGGLGQVVASPDGRAVYVLGPGVLLRYDVATRAVTGIAGTVPGRLAVAPDGTLYLGDSGYWGMVPSSGLLFRFSADLATVDTIDLGAAAVDGFGPTIQGTAPSRDGRTVYVLIGNNLVGVGQFPGQPKRILVVDAIAKRIVRSHPLSEWGGGPIFLR